MGVMARWRKSYGTMALAVVSLAGIGTTAPARNLYCSASEFVEYYRELQESPVPTGFLQRVAMSITMVKAEARQKPAPPAHRCGA